ncbi:hypothetical protein GCM10027048_27830 [Hymenobacter coalescens]
MNRYRYPFPLLPLSHPWRPTGFVRRWLAYEYALGGKCDFALVGLGAN